MMIIGHLPPKLVNVSNNTICALSYIGFIAFVWKLDMPTNCTLIINDPNRYWIMTSIEYCTVNIPTLKKLWII